MTSDVPANGSVVLYPYLWERQQDAGEIEGRKDRPACLVLSILDASSGEHHLLLVAITSQQPIRGQKAIEVPDLERQRAKLTRYSRAWIIMSEYNYDVAERSWYFDTSKKPLGTFSEPFLRQITDALRKEMRAGAKRIDRTT